MNFSKIQGILTLSHDVKGYKIFNPIATRVKMDMSEDYYFSTAKGFSNSGLAIITITNTINVQFVINHLTTFTGTVTTNVYQ